MALGLRLLRMRSVPGVVIGGVLLAAVVLRMYPYRPQAEPEDRFLDRIASGEGVFMAGFDASPVWGRGRDDLAWVSRSYSYWMVYAIALAEADGRMTPALEALRAQVLAAASQDIRCNPPQLILLQATPGVPGKTGPFSLDEFVMRDAGLRRFVGGLLCGGGARQGHDCLFPAPSGGARARARLPRHPLTMVAGQESGHCGACLVPGWARCRAVEGGLPR